MAAVYPALPYGRGVRRGVRRVAEDLPQLGDILAAELFWTSLASVRFAPDSDRIADIAEGPNRANNVKEVADIVGVAEATVNAHVLCAQETGRPGRDGR